MGDTIAFRCAEGNMVHIPVERFQEIERLLSQIHDLAPEDPESEQLDAEIEYVNAFPSIKSYRGIIPASIADNMGEERNREVGDAQSFEAVQTFQPMSDEQVDALLAKVAIAGSQRAFELFKMSSISYCTAITILNFGHTS